MSPANPIRVCLVEDQTLVRQGIRSLLALTDDMVVIGEANDGREALELIPQVKPDVVLLDLQMPRVDGLAVLRALHALNRLPPTLVLTTFDRDDFLFEALKYGAKGFLLKDVSLERLTGAIRTLAAGGTLIQPTLTDRARQSQKALPKPFPAMEAPERLTEKEQEVLRLLAGGYNNREIGDALGITEGTTKNHLSSILAKMGVRDRTRAVLKALEWGFI